MTKKSDRQKCLNEKPEPKYLYCTHCERAYKFGEYRQIDSLQLCPYENCSGDTIMDAMNWDQYRIDPQPKIPELNKRYPLWPSLKGV